MEYREKPNRPEPGASIYLVPNKYGPGKTAVRRPNPPPTSPPLNDDFDAITQAGTTTRGPESIRAATHRHQSARLPVRPQTTSTTARGSGLVPVTESVPRRRLRPRARAPRPRSSDTSSYGDISVYGHRGVSENGSDEHNEQGTHETYTGGTFGLRSGQKISVSTVVPDENYGMGFGKEMRRHAVTKGGREASDSAERRRGSEDGIGKRLGFSKRTSEGPRGGGHDYRMIDRRVIEDGPERTVTISTWREEVARKASHEMSVYYVNPDDYLAGNIAATAMDDQPRSKLSDGQRRTSWSSDTSSRNNKGARHNPAVDERPLPRERKLPPRETPPNSSSSPIDRIKSSVRSSTRGTRSVGGKSSSIVHSTTPVQRSYETAYRIHIPEPVRSHHSSNRTPPRTSTPSKGRGPPPAFHPTNSESSISSFDGTSEDSFKMILSTCSPSLLHIMPTLSRLGIRSQEHLRAVANLSEDTRDREVKEEALKNGVTVVEWAILLDRLQAGNRRTKLQ